MTPYKGAFNLRVATLAELGASSVDAVGIRILVEEDGTVYVNVGRTTDEIVKDRGWTERHIWTPDHVRTYIQKKHPAITNPVLAASQIIQQPDYVYIDERDFHNRIFVVDASVLRNVEAFQSTSTRYVDAIIERRPVEGGFILRLFHLSPRKKLPDGAQTWP